MRTMAEMLADGVTPGNAFMRQATDVMAAQQGLFKERLRVRDAGVEGLLDSPLASEFVGACRRVVEGWEAT